MARTEVRGGQVKDSTIGRSDLIVASSGEAVVRRLVAGANITLTSTGADTGTGDVTIDASGGSGISAAVAGARVALRF